MNYYADAPTSALSFMKYTELKDLTVQELTAKGRDLRQEVFNLRDRKSVV